MTPLISIITINYNSLDDTLEFLDSAAQVTYPNIEILIIDNASKINIPSPDTFKQYQNVTFIQSEENLGFAGGNNLGIAKAKGKYLAFLNNDTLLPTGFFEPIIQFMEENPNVGMASPKVLFPDGITIQYAGARAISPYTGRGKRLGLFEKDKQQYDKIYPTDLGHGAALFVPQKIIQEVGPMPEAYFLYYEEHDWCEQVKKKGYSMYYIGTSHLLHKESVSTGGDESPLKVYYLTRNRILFLRRNFSGLQFVIGVLFYTVISFPKGVLKYIVKGRFDLLKSFLNGAFWNLRSNIK